VTKRCCLLKSGDELPLILEEHTTKLMKTSSKMSQKGSWGPGSKQEIGLVSLVPRNHFMKRPEEIHLDIDKCLPVSKMIFSWKKIFKHYKYE
jgi:hypothetical protein